MFQSLSIASFVTSWRDGVGRVMYLRLLPDYLAWPARIIHQWKEKPREESMCLANSSWQLVSQIKKKKRALLHSMKAWKCLSFLDPSLPRWEKAYLAFCHKGSPTEYSVVHNSLRCLFEKEKKYSRWVSVSLRYSRKCSYMKIISQRILKRLNSLFHVEGFLWS